MVNYLILIDHIRSGLYQEYPSWLPGDDFNGSGGSSLDDGVRVYQSSLQQRHMLQQLCPGPRNLGQDCKSTEGIGTHCYILTHHQPQKRGDGTCVQRLGLT